MTFAGEPLQIYSPRSAAGQDYNAFVRELMEVEWPGVDLLKVPYHGRYTKGEEEFLMQLAPEYAVVTAAEAEPEVQEALSRTGAGIWNTREHDVTFMADGNGFFYLE